MTPGIQMLSAWLYGGLYNIEGYDFEYTNIFTHTTPTDAYRGAGRPEATYAVERTLDHLARELGMDPAEIRRKNYIPTENFPNFTIAAGLTVDSGDYPLTHDAMMKAVGYDDVRRQQKERQAAGTPSRSGSGSAPGPRCAASRRRACSTRSSTSPAGGTRRRSRCSPPARCGS